MKALGYLLNHNIQVESFWESSWNFESSSHELFLTLLFAFSTRFFLKFYSIKRSHITETKIDAKLDPQVTNTAQTSDTYRK